MKKIEFMKTTLRFTVLMTVLVLAFVACDDPNKKPAPGVDNTPKERVIVYKVGQNESRQSLATEGEWDALLDVLCNQAKQGSEVTFYNMKPSIYHPNKLSYGTKASKTFSTSNQDEMKSWMKEMEKEGRTVVVTYSNGTWNGVAYASAPPAATMAIIVGEWHFSRLVIKPMDADGQLQEGETLIPDFNGGSMFYNFYEDGTMSLTVNNIDGTSYTDNSTWSLSDDGKLCSELLPNGGGCWDINWISANTLVLSRPDFGTEDGDFLYQLEFDRQ